jgi:branched-chain amino acid transport system ATP-binding protein
MSAGAVAADLAPEPVAPLPESELLLKVEGIHTYYGKSHILDGVSLEIGRGEVVGLLGRNGVGKSTTLKAIAGLVPPSQGEVVFDGRSIVRLPSHTVARLGIAYVPEERRIFPFLTVLENLRTGLDRRGVGKARKAALLDKAYAYFPRLAERHGQIGGTLSGGEQQMLAIARAMMLEPKIILLDEPTEGLMPSMVSQIAQIVGSLSREGVAVLLVEQNVPLTLEACRRVYFIEKGVVRHHAMTAELHVDHPAIHQYLGV